MKFRGPDDGTASVENDPTTARFCGARVVGSKGAIPVAGEVGIGVAGKAVVRFWGKTEADVSRKFEVTDEV